MSSIIVVDVEATCWAKSDRVAESEIIEIGAVKLDPATYCILSEFDAFVHPVIHPVLSDFCVKLTTICQSDVDSAPKFSAAVAAFLSWIGDEHVTLCSWGEYDLRQFKLDCKRSNFRFPKYLERHHINLKQEFARQRRIRLCGYVAAMQLLHIAAAGTHHRGIDDARNIAKLANVVLPKLRT